MSDTFKIALLGTGLMGCPMGLNLLRAGHDLTVWNRTMTKTEPLVAAGASPADDPAAAVSGADVILTMLSDGFATAALIEDTDFRAALHDGQLWLDMSSAKPEHARAQSAELAGLGVAHVDAPVSGGTKGAEAGTLAIMAGGDEAAVERVRPVLEIMGNPVRVGPVGAGQLAKLANQAIVACTIGAVAEAMLLLERGGADPAAVRAALKGGFADSTILQQHGRRMTEGDFVPGGLVKFQIKDLDNVEEEASGLGLRLPAVHAVNDRFKALMDEMDGADLDHSALFLELKRRNGL